MRAAVFLFLLFALSAQTTYAQLNAGIVKGLWYSEPTVFADEPTRIYVAIRNNTGGDLTGRVEFYDNDELVARHNVSALDGRIIESWADWTPDFGSHTVKATLSRTELHKVGSSTKRVEVTSSIAEEILFIDYDTDRDGIGNEDDPDDDNDGISDETEKAGGTDPLKYDAPESKVLGTETNKTENEEAETETREIIDQQEYQSGSGLERFLAPSRARSVFEAVTETTQATKQNLDAYRNQRSTAKALESELPEETVVNDDGFGEIIRSTSSTATPAPAKKERSGFIETVIAVVNGVLQAIYTMVLAGLSLFLTYAIVVQLTLLFLILFLIYKLARRYGSRKN